MRDPYEILGAAADASADDIRRAFRRRAMEWHPDRNPHPDAPRRFREAVEAYECLRDPARRAAYDARDRTWDNARRQGTHGAGDAAQDACRRAADEARRRAEAEARRRAEPPPPPPPPSELELFLAGANARLRITPERLVETFACLDAVLRKVFA